MNFRRQRPFGPYVLDFYYIEKRLAIEADGGQHFTEEGLDADRGRTRYLEQRGVRVLRFTNREIILEGEGVIAVVQQALAARWRSGLALLLALSLAGGGTPTTPADSAPAPRLA